ncbi:uncharacterized protein GGS22DRAFT_168895 [Annulohypoxylon maeteangense]|uniref:uncharacterized protein n=1 Tax=Annulohypoxylon maeteangense TaxID=1927788 RepID=UPI002008C002|nr:uncharacterized protein GGS22DRAFT_168895 [Annulohypoxylon maeteangense]KAI0882831.1 hypothetical protein GGS22DRAFT_168895 [Annulohypoxylon maeteangense]
MARKGSRKVRTGCLTCKARKVKCDEAKPHCNRCINTGRACDGYVSKPTPGLLWHRPRQQFQSIDSASEGRALQFFCEKTAQFLSGATDPYFWTHLVMQFSNFEPAVRHSVVAISSLYEQFQDESASHSDVQLRDNSLALQHYNAAIRELKTTDNQPLVLLVCILFICIEFLQSNKEAAIQHCKHGIALLENTNYSWAREHLVPVFRRLSIFPYFFGVGSADFPDLVSVDEPLPPIFNTWADAQISMDSIMSRTLKLVRGGDMYRFGSLRYKGIPPDQLREQEEIGYLLNEWHILFQGLDTRSGLPATPVAEKNKLGMDFIQAMSRVILSVRYETCRIWLGIAFEANEICYDFHLDSFRRILDSCLLLDAAVPAAARTPTAKRSPRFIFETGFTPIIHFMATKCREYSMRLEALRLIKVLGVPRENLWEVDQMFAIARRVIEIEHGVSLDGSGQPITAPIYPNFPPDEKRIRFTPTEPKAAVYVDQNGKETRGWSVGFIMPGQQGNFSMHSEFITC